MVAVTVYPEAALNDQAMSFEPVDLAAELLVAVHVRLGAVLLSKILTVPEPAADP
jgi:hypothetical protein